MPDKKKYTAKQAAEMVLKKAEELLKKSELMKSEDASMKKGAWSGSYTSSPRAKGVGGHETGHEKGVSTVGKLGPHITSQTGNRDEKLVSQPSKEQHKKILGESKAMPKPNLPKSEEMDKVEGQNEEWGTAPKTKGHFKLAKFLGHIGSKRKSKKSL